MSSRFPTSTLNHRDPRSALFENYNGPSSSSNPSSNSNSTYPPNRTSSPYSQGGGYGYPSSSSSLGNDLNNGSGSRARDNFRPATPNSRGQYSDAVLNELESQNDGQVEGILGKVKMLKSMTIAIGDEIRDSSALAEKMNDSFDGTRVRLRGTMNRMLVMAQRTGVGWKVWLLFFAAVGALFFWVWVF